MNNAHPVQSAIDQKIADALEPAHLEVVNPRLSRRHEERSRVRCVGTLNRGLSKHQFELGTRHRAVCHNPRLDDVVGLLLGD